MILYIQLNILLKKKKERNVTFKLDFFNLSES